MRMVLAANPPRLGPGGHYWARHGSTWHFTLYRESELQRGRWVGLMAFQGSLAKGHAVSAKVGAPIRDGMPGSFLAPEPADPMRTVQLSHSGAMGRSNMPRGRDREGSSR
jgi:hypothetical protein